MTTNRDIPSERLVEITVFALAGYIRYMGAGIDVAEASVTEAISNYCESFHTDKGHVLAVSLESVRRVYSDPDPVKLGKQAEAMLAFYPDVLSRLTDELSTRFVKIGGPLQ